ncbi:hypothetical protein [Trinickia soli]|uniref:hypothetical protein n=1 Tax=Trinickia soli TaxID=380675 RepID=UPI001E491141|nr:hypothetical protein [Trinickia soli]
MSAQITGKAHENLPDKRRSAPDAATNTTAYHWLPKDQVGLKRNKKPRKTVIWRGSSEHIGTSRNISMVPGTGLEPASRKAADFRHTASFDAGDANIAVRALDYAFAVASHTWHSCATH